VGTNDLILMLVALFFVGLLLAIRQEEHRTVERRTQDLGPPDGVERRRSDRRRDSWLGATAWALRGRARRVAGWFSSGR
jgi:hypothetical protein